MIDIRKHADIVRALSAIESLEDVRIVYACESGSRAWGFDSPDSDYDVRFIYVRPLSWYIRISQESLDIDTNNGRKKTREYLRDRNKQDIDLVGWDLKKTLQLIYKGNPALIEWLRSDIVYSQDQKSHDTLKGLSEDFFRTESGIYHYEHMARKNFFQYIENVSGDVILKKYLYVIRPVLACEWIRQYRSAPPTNFLKLMEKLGQSQETSDFVRNILPYASDLVKRKQEGQELSRGPKIPELDRNCTVALHQKMLQQSTRSIGDDNVMDSAFRAIVFESIYT